MFFVLGYDLGVLRIISNYKKVKPHPPPPFRVTDICPFDERHVSPTIPLLFESHLKSSPGCCAFLLFITLCFVENSGSLHLEKPLSRKERQIKYLILTRNDKKHLLIQ